MNYRIEIISNQSVQEDITELLEQEIAEISRSLKILAKELNVPLSFHEENPELITNNGINRGKASAHYNIEGSPRAAEIDLIARDLRLAADLDAPINIQHISSREGVELVRQAKLEVIEKNNFTLPLTKTKEEITDIEYRNELEKVDLETLYKQAQEIDPEATAKVSQNDRKRITPPQTGRTAGTSGRAGGAC